MGCFLVVVVVVVVVVGLLHSVVVLVVGLLLGLCWRGCLCCCYRICCGLFVVSVDDVTNRSDFQFSCPMKKFKVHLKLIISMMTQLKSKVMNFDNLSVVQTHSETGER